MNISKYLLTFVTSLFSLSLFAQQNYGPGVGQWRSFLSYYQGTSLATDGTTFFAGTEGGFFTYNNDDGELVAYSKVNGMHDVDVAAVGHDMISGYTLIGYRSYNMDIFKDGRFYNLPDLQLSATIGDKAIRDIVAYNGFAYVSTGIGLVIVNLERKEVKATVVFYENGTMAQNYSSTFIGNDIIVATSAGVFKSALSNPLIQTYDSWEEINPNVYNFLKASGNNIYTADASGVYHLDLTGASTKIYDNANVAHLDAGKDGNIWVCLDTVTYVADNKMLLLAANGNHVDSFLNVVHPKQTAVADDGSVWGIQSYNNIGWAGLRKMLTVNSSESHTPSGPWAATAFDTWARNGELWLAHGSVDIDWTYKFNYSFFSHYYDDWWTNYGDRIGPASSPPDAPASDCVRIIKDVDYSGNIYAATFTGGVYELKPDGTLQNFREGMLERAIGDTGSYRTVGLQIDAAGNLWVCNYSAPNELKVKTRSGDWYGFHVQQNSGRKAADLVIDDAGQKWYVAPATGLAVYNDNGTIENTSDDKSKLLVKGAGAGNLPDNNVLCVAKDKDGAIWCGTLNGIGIISCPELVLQNQCEGELRAVQYPGQVNAGYLFMDQAVTSIAVDGGNRKWVGTTNSGAWLISDDGEELLQHFTADNSPLPSDQIIRINIDPITGDVYFATSKGLVSYRGEATEGNSRQEDKLLIYPNPVPPGFSGSVAVRGVAENSDVRITDISGQLVYRTNAYGGQAVWNLKDYTNRRVQTGVYLIFVVSKNGEHKKVGKVIVNE